MTMLSLIAVNKSYLSRNGRLDIISNVTITIKKGEFAAITGPSGSGKSTLMFVAGGLMRPEKGTVTIDGKNIYSMKDGNRTAFRAATIGFVFQEFYLVPYLTIRENILFAAVSGDKNNVIRAAETLMREFSIYHRADHLPEKLSTGEKQRTALCRALINRPKILFADEPTGNLDAENAGVLCNFFSKFAREGGTVVMVTHDPAIAARADKRYKLVDKTLAAR